MEKVVKFGLMEKSTKKLLTYSYSHNDNAEDSVDDSYILTSSEYDPLWLVDEKRTACLAKISSPWFNADYESPQHKFNENDLAVVKITLNVEEDDEY